jgi:hypothetical protein
MLLVKGNGIIVQCCVCRKYKLVDDTFANIDESTIDPSKVSHTYCPDCFAVVMAEIKNSK